MNLKDVGSWLPAQIVDRHGRSDEKIEHDVCGRISKKIDTSAACNLESQSVENEHKISAFIDCEALTGWSNFKDEIEIRKPSEK